MIYYKKFKVKIVSTTKFVDKFIDFKPLIFFNLHGNMNKGEADFIVQMYNFSLTQQLYFPGKCVILKYQFRRSYFPINPKISIVFSLQNLHTSLLSQSYCSLNGFILRATYHVYNLSFLSSTDD